MSFEIVRSDFGRTYRGIIKNEDMSDCSAAIYVWDANRRKIIDGKACAVSKSGSDTYIDFTPEEGDFDVEPGTYHGQFKLSRAGVVERTLSFTWRVFEKEP